MSNYVFCIADFVLFLTAEILLQLKRLSITDPYSRLTILWLFLLIVLWSVKIRLQLFLLVVSRQSKELCVDIIDPSKVSGVDGDTKSFSRNPFFPHLEKYSFYADSIIRKM